MARSIYCLECAAKSGWLPSSSFGATGFSEYQLEKFVKHTAPTGWAAGPHSVFGDPSAGQYREYIVLTAASGYYDRSNPAKPTLCYFAHEKTGNTYLNGRFQTVASGVRMVCIGDDMRFHAFPDASILQSATCTGCGKSIPAP